MAKLKTPVFRVSFPSFFHPTGYQNQPPLKYKVDCIVPKDWDDSDYPDNPYGDNEKAMQAIKDEIERVGEEKFGKEWKKIKKRQYALPVRCGSEKDDVDGYGEDMEFFKISSKSKPRLVDRRRQPILEDDEPGIQPGDYAVASISIFAYDKGKGGVSIGMGNVQKIATGEPLGGRTTPEQDFEEWDDDEDDLLD